MCSWARHPPVMVQLKEVQLGEALGVYHPAGGKSVA